MNKSSRTYRLVALLTALLILVGIGSPAGLLAAAHCTMASEAAPVMQHHGGVQGSAHHASDLQTGTNSSDCDTGISCDCCTIQTVVKTRSAQSFNRTEADFSAIVIDILDEDHQTTFIATQYVDLESQAGNASPPIFLKNSTFLN